MAILDVLHFPDPRLRTVAKPVTSFGKETQQLVENMYETMYNQNGIGLAATQVNIHFQILVLDVSEERDSPHCFINPQLISSEGSKDFDEACLSVPGESATISRPDVIKVRAYDQSGEVFEKECDKLMSICLQHEMDHLKGKLFIDYLSPLKRSRIEKKMLKKSKQSD